MTPSPDPYRNFRFPAEVIQHAVSLYRFFSPSLGDVEFILAACGVMVSYKSIRERGLRFGRLFANTLKLRGPRPGDKWHLDKVFPRIQCKLHPLWRAVDQHGHVLDTLVQSRRSAKAASPRAMVEQKNGAIVRRLVGYGRFEGVLTGESLGRLYAAARLHGKLFQPSFKLWEKCREGTRVIKRYHAPEPPVARALAHAAVSDADKARLRDMLGNADPVLLLVGIRSAQAELGRRVDERGLAGARSDPPAPIDLTQFTASLNVAWLDGERRPTHQRRYVRVKPVVQTSMLDQLLVWLEAHSALTAVDALERLRGLHPDRFSADHLRTVQRFMKVRRATMAREVLLSPVPASAGLALGRCHRRGRNGGWWRHGKAR